MPSWNMISADDHVDLWYLPGDLWEKRVPQRYLDRVPHLIDTDDSWHWEVDGKLFGRSLTKNDINSATFGHWTTPVTQETGHWRPTTPELRLADMDRDRVEAQVLYGGLNAGFSWGIRI